jgi:6-phosphogluconolactonase
VEPTAKFAYVANRFGSNISAYSIGSNGTLNPIPDSPFAAGYEPYSVAVDPTAKFFYVGKL